MRSSIFVSVAAFAGAAVAQSSSIDPAPQTNYLTQTNSLGVVTGGPAAATAQPSVITSQPAAASNVGVAASNVGVAASIPAVAPGIWTIPLPAGGNNTSLISYIVSADSSTTVILNAPTSSAATATGSGASGSGAATRSGSASGSATGSGSASSSQGAASNVQVAAGGLLGFGALMAAFL
ncbi:hypothetical protein P153DRAFT_429663 [Dothidotthia symphoricarpi CBS 119687]|uniref:GPI anchored protein n=1 Tax=Dothidotthia symphoricarpi CBS 119687 TaxID=1392245 RepID=A0A6A6ALK0_9PLEO|nr:uncharacterized protein P153DRAFT_429663 [Dothidotthia symphoricarpi CBS 119687]KAF2131341.1 hypothetical protein P153DRAFT_429663 [Dothidotthia symphoricarpi CBS 119687]